MVVAVLLSGGIARVIRRLWLRDFVQETGSLVGIRPSRHPMALELVEVVLVT